MVHLHYRNIYSDPLFIFELCSLGCWVAKDLYVLNTSSLPKWCICKHFFLPVDCLLFPLIACFDAQLIFASFDVCTEPSQSVFQPRVVWGPTSPCPDWCEKLLAVDGFQGKGNFFLRVWALVIQSCSSGSPYTQEYKGSTNWTWWVILKWQKKKKEDRKWDRVGVDLGRVRGKVGSEYEQKHCIHLWTS